MATNALELNIDAAQRELDRRNAEGEDVSHLVVCQKTAAIVPTRAAAPIQQFRVTLAPDSTIDVCGDYLPHQALFKAQCALDLFSSAHAPMVQLCIAGADGKWERFDDVTPPDALIGHAVKLLAEEFPALGLSFGYIGNVDLWGDDRGFRVFSNQRSADGRSLSFGDYSTAHLPDMLEAVKAGRVRTWCESLARNLA